MRKTIKLFVLFFMVIFVSSCSTTDKVVILDDKNKIVGSINVKREDNSKCSNSGQFISIFFAGTYETCSNKIALTLPKGSGILALNLPNYDISSDG